MPYIFKDTKQLLRYYKNINQQISEKTAKQFRRRVIQSAYYIRDKVADNAPKKIYKDIILGEKLEKRESDSGFNVNVVNGAYYEFQFRISVRRFNKPQYKGWNPVLGLIISNYGRRGFSSSSSMPIPVNQRVDKKGKKLPKYNHPVKKYGYQNMYAYSHVVFARSVRPLQGIKWIESAISSSQIGAKKILAGQKDYKTRYSWGGRFYG